MSRPGPRSPPWLRHPTVVVAVIFAVLATAALAVTLWPLRRDSMAAQQRTLHTVATMLADALDQRLASVELTLRVAERELLQAAAAGASTAALSTRLRQICDPSLPMPARCWLVDGEGRSLGASEGGPPPPLAASLVADLERPGHRAQPAWLGLAPPDPAAGRAQALVTLALRLSRSPAGADGSAPTWLVAGLPAEALSALFTHAVPAPDARLLVRRRDGLRLAGHLGSAVSDDDRELARLAQRNGPLELGDGAQYLVQVAVLPHYPIELVLTRDLEASLARWRELSHLSALVMLAVTLAVLALWTGWARAERARTRAQAALQAEQARTAAAAAAAQEGSWDWDAASGEVYLSPRMRVLLGLSAGADWDSTLAAEDRDALHAALKAAHEDPQQAIDLQLRARQPDGSWRHIQLRGRTCGGDETGAAPGRHRVAGVASDVSAQHAQAEQTRRLEAQLARARRLESLGTLAGGVAHDFNNLLAVLMGHAEMAAEDTPPGSAQARHLDRILLATQRGRAMVRRILAFGGSGQRPCTPVCVQGAVEQSLLLLALPPGVVLERQLAAEPLWVMGDATALGEALSNLCDNAALAMPQGGRLGVELAAVELARTTWLSHGHLAPGQYVRLRVSDSGSGVPAEVMERLFEPFFTTRGRRGTGLGLAVVHGLVQDCGGAIDVSNHLDRPGCSFTMLLPRAAAPARPAEAATPGPCASPACAAPPGQGQTLLVVDDEPALVELAEERLALAGYEAVGFTDPLAACAAFEAEPERYDLLLSDEVMPAMRGTELARRLKALRPGLPVLLLSGYGGPQLQAAAQAAGVHAVLMKPLPAEALQAAVAAALAGRSIPSAEPAAPVAAPAGTVAPDPPAAAARQ